MSSFFVKTTKFLVGNSLIKTDFNYEKFKGVEGERNDIPFKISFSSIASEKLLMPQLFENVQKFNNLKKSCSRKRKKYAVNRRFCKNAFTYTQNLKIKNLKIG